jgi:flagellar basal-body rod protein FlgB
MFDSTPLMQTNYLLEQGMDAESLRRRVIANNISNVDVPHFRRSEVNFESQLRRVIEEQGNPGNQLPALMTDRRHIPFFVPGDIHDVEPRVNLDYSTVMRNDGNNVDIEKEMVDAAKNMMRYNAFVTSYNNNVRMLRIAMRASV